MIGRLRGSLVVKVPGLVVLDVAGVGYEMAVTARALAELPQVGEEVVLHTHLHVREDQLALFGFVTSDDRDLFRLLLGAAGIGPKVGLAILATLTGNELRRAVVSEDTAALEMVPGIGKRSAQKLILELRPKMSLPDMDLPTTGASASSEVREALEGLGYQPQEIRAVLADLPTDGEVPDLLRAALQALGRA